MDHDFSMRFLILWLVVLIVAPLHQRTGFSAALSLPINHTIPHAVYTSNDPDPRFRWEIEYLRQPLNHISLLMNAVNALATLAHQQFGERVRDDTVLVSPLYPGSNINILPTHPNKSFDNRLAVWGLYGAIREMVFANDYREAIVDLFWDDKQVATIVISKPQTVLNSNLNTDLTTTPVTAPDGLQVGFKYMPDGAALDVQAVFLTVMSTLQVLAHWDDTVEVYPFTCSAEGLNDTILQVDSGRGPRKSPPYLLVQYVIDAARQIPGYMLANSTFADLAVGILFKGALIGQLLIYRAPLDHLQSTLES